MAIEVSLVPRTVPLVEGMTVRRVLPLRGGRMLGPFAFLDEIPPTEFGPGKNGDVGPHPHIGLSTLSYLFEGRIIHRDSLGNVQAITPGDVNWMTAGKGIVHSERIPSEDRDRGARIHLLQAWVALPVGMEEVDPSFQHHAAESLPRFEVNGVKVHLVAGSAFGRSADVRISSRLFYFCAEMEQGQKLDFDPEFQESGFYLLSGEIEVEGQVFSAPKLIVFKPGSPIRINSKQASRGVLLGGDRLDGQRTIYWNFVSSSKDRIEQAKRDWRAQVMPKIPGETEFIPLPEA